MRANSGLGAEAGDLPREHPLNSKYMLRMTKISPTRASPGTPGPAVSGRRKGWPHDCCMKRAGFESGTVLSLSRRRPLSTQELQRNSPCISVDHSRSPTSQAPKRGGTPGFHRCSLPGLRDSRAYLGGEFRVPRSALGSSDREEAPHLPRVISDCVSKSPDPSAPHRTP